MVSDLEKDGMSILKAGDRVLIEGESVHSIPYEADFQRWAEELVYVDGASYCVTVALIMLDNNEIESVRPKSMAIIND